MSSTELDLAFRREDEGHKAPRACAPEQRACRSLLQKFRCQAHPRVISYTAWSSDRLYLFGAGSQLLRGGNMPRKSSTIGLAIATILGLGAVAGDRRRFAR